jgi:hypothetical protein
LIKGCEAVYPRLSVVANHTPKLCGCQGLFRAAMSLAWVLQVFPRSQLTQVIGLL